MGEQLVVSEKRERNDGSKWLRVSHNGQRSGWIFVNNPHESFVKPIDEAHKIVRTEEQIGTPILHHAPGKAPHIREANLMTGLAFENNQLILLNRTKIELYPTDPQVVEGVTWVRVVEDSWTTWVEIERREIVQQVIARNGIANPRDDMIGFDHWIVPTFTTLPRTYPDGRIRLRGFGGMGWIGWWHMGSDFYGSNNNDVVAVADGQVMRIRGYREQRHANGQPIYSIMIKHDGPFVVRGVHHQYLFSIYQVYGRNRERHVDYGDFVTSGQVIARNGSAFPLHFEIRISNERTPNIPDRGTDILSPPPPLPPSRGGSIDWNYHIDPRWIFRDHLNGTFLWGQQNA